MPENKPTFRKVTYHVQSMLPRAIKDLRLEISTFSNTTVDFIEWEMDVDYNKKRYKLHCTFANNEQRKKNKVIFFIDIANRKYTGFSVDLQFNQTTSKWRDLMDMIRILHSSQSINKTQAYLNRNLSERILLRSLINATLQ